MKQVTQNTVPLIEIQPVRNEIDPADQATIELEIEVVNWYRRITGAVGGSFLFAALLYWAARPGHYRPVLVLLIVAMLAAILHTYAFEDGQTV
ncbi:MAG: hypothetical protein ACR2JC_07595 [Chloroflexota bacterium]|nr:MAG: hypothetical protein DLM70_03595 [Chloroflexota bacterium]